MSRIFDHIQRVKNNLLKFLRVSAAQIVYSIGGELMGATSAYCAASGLTKGVCPIQMVSMSPNHGNQYRDALSIRELPHAHYL